MNPFKAIIAAVVLTSAASQAATITLQVQVKGYSSAGWVLVRPELRSVLGGKVAYLPQHGGWVTDRVARGEAVRLNITPSSPREEKCKVAVLGVNINNAFAGVQAVPLPCVGSFVVSSDPRVDSVRMAVNTAFGTTEYRVPIGSR